MQRGSSLCLRLPSDKSARNLNKTEKPVQNLGRAKVIIQIRITAFAIRKGWVFMKLSEKAVAIGLIIAIMFTFTGFCKTKENIANEVLRLHIIANSDSEEDQSLKLKVRDEILKRSDLIISDGDNLQLAIDEVSSSLNEIETIANEVIKNEGFDYTCKAEITQMYFNIREYENISMPSGEYTALRVTLGKGEGKNWWCVMFPPLCLPAAEKEVQSFSEKEQEILAVTEPQYEIKFKVVEIWENIKNKLKEG